MTALHKDLSLKQLHKKMLRCRFAIMTISPKGILIWIFDYDSFTKDFDFDRSL